MIRLSSKQRLFVGLRKAAFLKPLKSLDILERAKGFEPSTPTLARLCSTPELHPHPERQSGARPNRLGGGFMTQSATGCKRLCRKHFEKSWKKANKPLLTSQKLFENQTKPDYPALS